MASIHILVIGISWRCVHQKSKINIDVPSIFRITYWDFIKFKRNINILWYFHENSGKIAWNMQVFLMHMQIFEKQQNMHKYAKIKCVNLRNFMKTKLIMRITFIFQSCYFHNHISKNQKIRTLAIRYKVKV